MLSWLKSLWFKIVKPYVVAEVSAAADSIKAKVDSTKFDEDAIAALLTTVAAREGVTLPSAVAIVLAHEVVTEEAKSVAVADKVIAEVIAKIESL